MDLFLSRPCAGDDRHRTFGNAEYVGEDVDELGVSGTIDWSGVETYEQRLTAHAGNT